MNLDESQKRQVAAWMDQGLKLSEIQARLASELRVSLTYMEVRFLVDDLKLTPKDPEPPKAAVLPAAPGKESTPAGESPPEEIEEEELLDETDAAPASGNVSVTVDTLARPGALVSGSVTFSDGNTATWQLDQYGRLGVAPQKQGYKPAPADVQSFQLALQRELQKMGF